MSGYSDYLERFKEQAAKAERVKADLLATAESLRAELAKKIQAPDHIVLVEPPSESGYYYRQDSFMTQEGKLNRITVTMVMAIQFEASVPKTKIEFELSHQGGRAVLLKVGGVDNSSIQVPIDSRDPKLDYLVNMLWTSMRNEIEKQLEI